MMLVIYKQEFFIFFDCVKLVQGNKIGTSKSDTSYTCFIMFCMNVHFYLFTDCVFAFICIEALREQRQEPVDDTGSVIMCLSVCMCVHI